MKAIVGLFLVFAAGVMSSSSALAWGESFRATCNVRYESSTRILADCEDSDGYSHYNDFNRVGCVGDISNNDGYLQCSRQGNGGGRGRLPYGSYTQTCHSCSVDSRTLQCQCADTRGYYHYTSLYNYSSCRGDIANMYGNLTCSR